MKYILIFNLCFLATFSQPTISWQKTYGGSALDVLNEMDFAPNGYYLGGVSNSNISGEKSQNSIGFNDCWILSINELGQIIWQKTIGGSSDDGIVSLSRTNDDGVIIGGGSNSNISGDKTENSRGLSDYWIIKLDVNGNIQWQRTIGGSFSDGLRSIRQTSDNGYILGGLSESNISGEKTENSRALSYDYWILKLDSFGNIEWQKTYGGDDLDDLIAIRQTADNGYIIAGNSYSNANYDKTENARGNGDYWILRLDAQGNILWQRTLGGTDVDVVTDVIENSFNGFYVGGFSFSGISGDKTEESKGICDFWLLKLDSLGNIVWQKTIGGSDGDFLYSMIENSDNSLMLAGSSHSNISGDKSENSRGIADMWLLKLNENGTILWQKTIGGSLADGIDSIMRTIDNGYALGGYSRSSISGEKNENCRGETDYWIVKLTDDNLSVNENLNNDFTVYPNPTNGVFSIVLPNNENIAELMLTDLTGKRIDFNKSAENKINFEGESGLYFLTILTNNNIKKTIKIFKN